MIFALVGLFGCVLVIAGAAFNLYALVTIGSVFIGYAMGAYTVLSMIRRM